MKEYVTSSLETHLFFGRIMKEHALFLQAGFPAGETGYSNKAGCGKYRDHEMADRMGCQIRRLNQWVLQLLNGLIMFKSRYCGRLLSADYTRLIIHC